MAAELPTHGKFEVTFTGKSIVKAIGPMPEAHVLRLSNLDLLSGRFPVTYFYFYRGPLPDNFSSVINSLKNSLAQTLNHFYPFAGRVVTNSSSNEPEIICDNNGALKLKPISPKRTGLLQPGLISTYETGLSISQDIPLQIQVTRYTCEGISKQRRPSIMHLVMQQLLEPPYCVLPPSYDPLIDHSFVACNMEEILNIPTPRSLAQAPLLI
ncbi:LOW QUALITY PROTEIN: hypothetical protein RJ641_034983 [Dillenia turbinata]|uniref:Uncharacterized protein n=1 Tax=Dillenia turbinata TaxID=194707 RepID=A0AAN8VVE5_9MAGN